MNNIDEMLEVLNAYKRGEKIEYYNDAIDRWWAADDPSWDFAEFKYRIAKPEPKKVKLEAWLSGTKELRWFHEDAETPMLQQNKWTRVPSVDMEITLP